MDEKPFGRQDAREEAQAEVIVPRPEIPPPEAPKSVRERMAPVIGLHGSKIPARTKSSGTQPSPEVEADTLLGDPGNKRFDPGWVVDQLQLKPSLSPVDEVNLACAVAWLGLADRRAGRPEAAREKWTTARDSLLRVEPLLTSDQKMSVANELAAIEGILAA